MYEIQHIKLKYRRIKYVVIISSRGNARIRGSGQGSSQGSPKKKNSGAEWSFSWDYCVAWKENTQNSVFSMLFLMYVLMSTFLMKI